MNGQTEREYRDALDSLQFSDEAKERMMKNLIKQQEQKPAKRRGVRPLRAGLIAAAVCLALVGTAFAATNPEVVAAFINRLSVQFLSGKGTDGYCVAGEIIEYSPEQFSSELLELCKDTQEPGSITLDTGTWEETKAFMGEAIPFAEPKDWNGEFCVKIFREPPEAGWKPMLIEAVSVWPGGGEVYSNRAAGTDSIVMRAYAYDPGETLFTFFDDPEKGYERLETYAMPDGTEAEIIMNRDTEENSMCICSSYFIKDGILYEVRSHGYAGTEAALAAHVKTILDSFK